MKINFLFFLIFDVFPIFVDFTRSRKLQYLAKRQSQWKASSFFAAVDFNFWLSSHSLLVFYFSTFVFTTVIGFIYCTRVCTAVGVRLCGCSGVCLHFLVFVRTGTTCVRFAIRNSQFAVRNSQFAIVRRKCKNRKISISRKAKNAGAVFTAAVEIIVSLWKSLKF